METPVSAAAQLTWLWQQHLVTQREFVRQAQPLALDQTGVPGLHLQATWFLWTLPLPVAAACAASGSVSVSAPSSPGLG